MPKGGLLHLHPDASVAAPVLLQIALKHPAVHVRANVRLTTETLADAVPEFRGLPPDEWTTGTSITSEDYELGTWVPLARARETFDAALGGPEGFDRWACAAMTISPREAYGTYDTTDKVRADDGILNAWDADTSVTQIWQKFGMTFEVSRVSALRLWWASARVHCS